MKIVTPKRKVVSSNLVEGARIIGEFVYRALNALTQHGLADTMWWYTKCPFFRVDLCANGKNATRTDAVVRNKAILL